MFAPWKKSCDKPRQNIKKQRYHFADKGPYNQSYVLFCFVLFFPVIMYGCEIWTIKKAEHRRTDALELNTIQKRVPWTARGPVNTNGNQP